jgi:hypothetical protein
MSAQRWRLAVATAAALSVAAGCTDGTTPDCSDAQCAVVSVVEAGADAGDGGPDGADTGDAAADAPETLDAKPGEMSDVAADAPPAPSEAGSDVAPDAKADGG